MLRRDLLQVLLASPLTGWVKPWIPSQVRSLIEEPNAALSYQKAFGWSKGLQPDALERLRNCVTAPLDDPFVDILIQKARPALELIREAATIDVCRWEPEDLLPGDYFTQGRHDVSNVHIIYIACLSGRQFVKQGRGRDALIDVFAGLTLAHRVGTGGVQIDRLIECSGEVPAFKTLGRILPDLNRATLGDLSRRLDLLPSPEPASAVIGPESRFILGYLRTKLATTGPVIEGEQWAEIGFNNEEAETLKRLTGGDRTRLLAHLETTGPTFVELARRIDLPRPGCRKSLDEFAKHEQSMQPIVAGLVENVWAVRHMVDRMRALRAMLRAGLVLIRDGELAFRAEADPFGDGAFGLERRKNGYLIRSALNDEGKPEVTLQIGEAA